MPVLPELEPMLARVNEARSQGVDAAATVAQRREVIHRAMDQRVAAVAAAGDDLADNINHYRDADKRREPFASPALADDLAGLPPALIMTAEYDVLRDDGDLYGRRLNEAGTPARAIWWAGHIHGSHEMTAMLPSARAWQAKAQSYLREANNT